jgi:hypothetical protein
MMNFSSHGARMDDGTVFHEQLKQEIHKARRDTFALVEALVGHQSNWPAIRSQVLKIFGRDGLESLLNNGTASNHGMEHEQKEITVGNSRKS